MQNLISNTLGEEFYIYGKHNSRDSLFNQIIKSSKKNGERINVTSKLTRDYLHIKKISKLLLNLVFKKKILTNKYLF